MLAYLLHVTYRQMLQKVSLQRVPYLSLYTAVVVALVVEAAGAAVLELRAENPHGFSPPFLPVSPSIKDIA